MIRGLKLDRSRVVVGATAGLALLLLLTAVAYLLSLRGEFAGEIELVEPRTARLLGILQSADQLDAAGGRAEAMLRDLAYPAGRDSATMAAGLQQDVRELLSEAGMTVTGSQVLPVRQAEGHDRLTLEITAEGNVQALDEALSGLELMRPLVFIESLTVKPVRTRSRRGDAGQEGDVDPRRVSVRFQCFALRLHS